MTSPVRWAGDTLELLDQRRLPAEATWLRCSSAADVAEAIRALAVRGAPAIGVAAAYGAVLAARGGDFDTGAELIERARPTAVNLTWAVAQARETWERERSDEALLELARRIHRAQEEADARIASHAVELFAEGSRVLTHCNTGALATAGRGTAGGVIDAAFRAGRVEHVWVDETRPLLQGARLTAWELQRAGIPFRVVTDSSVGALMARGLVDRVVVGADRIAANGDVANKIGTYTVAVLADRHEVPFYVAAPVSTIDPGTPSGDRIPIEERDPAEVTADFDAANFAFDVTPASLVTAIVTEAGVLEPPYADSIARALEVARAG